MAFDGPGFHVEVGTIEDAAKAMGEITRKQDDFSLEDLCGRYEQYGHDEFCDALDNFCGKFNGSVDMLVDKSGDMREGLQAVAKAYRSAEHANKDVLKDPGIQAVEEH